MCCLHATNQFLVFESFAWYYSLVIFDKPNVDLCVGVLCARSHVFYSYGIVDFSISEANMWKVCESDENRRNPWSSSKKRNRDRNNANGYESVFIEHDAHGTVPLTKMKLELPGGQINFEVKSFRREFCVVSVYNWEQCCWAMVQSNSSSNV